MANLEPLTNLLRAGDPWCRALAARALASLGDVEAVPALIHAGVDEDPVVRTEVERALAWLWQKATEAERAFLTCTAASGPVRLSAEPSIETAAQVLATRAVAEDARERLAAVRALAEVRAAAAVPPLMHATRDVDPEVRCAAVEALAGVASACPDQRRGIESVLRRARHDGHDAVQGAANRALGAIQQPRVDRTAAARAAFVAELRAASVDEAAEMLFERGRSISGRPLERSEWREIAAALRGPRHGGRIAALVAAAERRDQALRALRLARRTAAPVARGTWAARPSAVPRTMIGLLLMDEEVWAEQEPCNCTWCQPYEGDAWRLWTNDAGLRLTSALPVNAVQEELHAAIGSRRTALLVPADFGQLHARLDEAELSRVFATVSTGHLPADLRAFVDRFDLGAFVAASTLGEPIRTGPELAVISLLEEQHQRVPEGEVDWPAIADWLAARIVQPAEPDVLARRAVVRAFLRFVAEAPRSARLALRPALTRAHEDHRPLLAARLDVREDAAPGLVEAAIGSTLVLHDLARNLQDLHDHGVPEPSHPVVSHHIQPRDLLRVGAGTLRRLDYPSFTIVSRPAVSLVRPETLAALAEIADDLARADELVMRASAEDLIQGLVADADGGVFAGLPMPVRRAVARAVEEHAIAHVVLENVILAAAPERVRVRRRQVRRFWASPPADVPADLAALRDRFDADRVKEGLVAALLDQLHEGWVETAGAHLALKEGLIHALRLVAATYGFVRVAPPRPDEEAGVATARLVDHLVQQLVHAPLEIAQALGITHAQGLPRLQGGHATPLERRFRRALREATSSATVAGEASPPSVFTCRPLSKVAALRRGELGRDCSSTSVPLRALSPHHVYYGIWEGGDPRPGYMTVYEAWADRDGERIRVLCLETINVPIDRFDPIQQDLLLVFDAIAKSRGLAPEVVLITGIGTWNYGNGFLLQGSRRFRRGRRVKLSPADPVSWRLYESVTSEAHYYSAFNDDRGDYRILAPFDADLDAVQPENLEEARRIAALPARTPVVTVRGEDGPLGFISTLPEAL